MFFIVYGKFGGRVEADRHGKNRNVERSMCYLLEIISLNSV